MELRQTKIRKWMQAVGQEAPDCPVWPDNITKHLRLRLLLEEVLELAEALGTHVVARKKNHALTIDDLYYITQPAKIENLDEALTEVADALADISYVNYGAANAFGIDMEPIEDEVQRSNDSKIIDGYKDPQTGKWKKGKSYSPPKLKPLIVKQINK